MVSVFMIHPIHIIHLLVFIQDEGDLVTCFCVTPDGEYLVVACQSLQLKQWTWRGQEKAAITRKWKV